MRKVIVLGGGIVGAAVVRDLAQTIRADVADISAEALSKFDNFEDKRAGIKTHQVDLKWTSELQKVIKDYDIVVNATPGDMGFKVAETVLMAGKDMVDISFYPEDYSELNKIAIDNKVRYLADFGIAPGCSNLIFGYEKITSSWVEYFVCYVGGLPVNRTLPWEYKAPFSPRDVLAEYVRPARFISRGVKKSKPALSDPEFLEIPGVGTLEAFLTDGVRSLLSEHDSWSIVEKTLRYPKYRDKVKFLKDIGLLNEEPLDNDVAPLDITGKLLTDAWAYDEGEEDLTVMRINVRCRTEGKPGLRRRQWNLIDYYDRKTATSSMARTTGYTCAAGVRLLFRDLWKEIGAIAPERVGADRKCFEFVMGELEERNVKFEIKELEVGEVDFASSIY